MVAFGQTSLVEFLKIHSSAWLSVFLGTTTMRAHHMVGSRKVFFFYDALADVVLELRRRNTRLTTEKSWLGSIPG